MMPFRSTLLLSLSLAAGTGAVIPPLAPVAAAAAGSQIDDVAVANGAVQLVRLRRREARPVGQNVTGKFFYTARIFVGHPRQALQVAFDTSSGQVILPTSACDSQACFEHRRYHPTESTMAVDINADGTLAESGSLRDAISIGFSSLDLGDGSVTGHLLADAICLSADSDLGGDRPMTEACAGVGLVAATHLSDTPFRAAPFDGTIGLGMRGLSISKMFSFIEQMSNLRADLLEPQTPEEVPGLARVQPLPQFALYHGSKFGEVAFGGFNPQRSVSPLAWVPVASPADGYWQVQILRIRVANKTLSACQGGSCRGILDSGTSNVGIPAKLMPEFLAAFASSPHHRQASGACGGPDLHLELSGGVELTLTAADYADGDSCAPSVSSLDLPESFAGVFILGEPLLKRYYTVFDWREGAEQIGFGFAALPGKGEEDAVIAAELLEDMQEAKESKESSQVGQDSTIAELLCAFLSRVALVMTLLFLGTRFNSGKAFFDRIESFLAYKTLLREVAEFASAVPANEEPEADDCVICLGCCEDEAVPGLQHGQPLADEKGQSNCISECSGGSLRWRRLRCGHHFHETCIVKWLRKSKQCPTCRRHFVRDPELDEPTLRMATRSSIFR